jgi:hypothetical protein
MKKVALFLAMVLVCGVCFAETTFKVENGVAIVSETLGNQPVTMQGQDGKSMSVPGAKRNITTTFEVTKEQAQMQIIQLGTQRANIIKRVNEQIDNIDAQIKLLKDIDTALPNVAEEKPKE